MKKFLLGSVGLAAMLVGPAMAADMRAAPPPAPPPVVYYDWSGAYIGGTVGGVWYDVTRTYTGSLVPPSTRPPATAMASSASTLARRCSTAPGCGAWKRR